MLLTIEISAKIEQKPQKKAFIAVLGTKFIIIIFRLHRALKRHGLIGEGRTNRPPEKGPRLVQGSQGFYAQRSGIDGRGLNNHTKQSSNGRNVKKF